MTTNKEYVLKHGGGFGASGNEVQTVSNRHDVHLALNSEMGCHGANTAVGFHKPDEESASRRHPIPEEILVIHSGKGECYLYDKWIPAETEDVVFASLGALHGTRNPAGNTEDFVTLGVVAPSQFDLYLHAGYDVLGDSSGEYVEKVQRGNWRKEKRFLIHIVRR